MRTITRTALSIGAVMALAVAIPASAAASAVALVYTTGPGSDVTGWDAPVLAVAPNTPLTFLNADVKQHDFVAEETGGDQTRSWCTFYPAGSCPLFFSPRVGLSKSTAVAGLDQLVPGQIYTFICTLHPQMRGALVALPPAPA